MTREIVTLERLKEVLDYDPATGEFRRTLCAPGYSVGDLAGTISSTDGMRYISIDGKKYVAHRLAWLYVTGEWPGSSVGFKDRSIPSPFREKFDNISTSVQAGQLTAEQLREILDYDPLTGIFTRKTAGRGVTVGKRVGSVEPNGYRYISIKQKFYPAQRLAWLYTYGVWPERVVRFRNEIKDDCRIENLWEGAYDTTSRVSRNAYNRAHRAAHPAQYRDAELRKKFGMDAAEYERRLAEQNGVCAICGHGEIVVRKGRALPLAVDHDHKSGIVRDLLCTACNVMVGYSKDDPAVLRAAAAYLERHSALPDNVIPLPRKEPIP